MTTAAFGAYIQSTYGPGSNIYQANGSLSGDRILNGTHLLHSLTFTSLGLFNVTGPVELGSTFKLTTGASVGHVLTSDAIGDATWQATTAGSFIGLTDTPLLYGAAPSANKAVTVNATFDGLIFDDLKAGSGGTGQSVYAVGDLLYADTTGTLAKSSPTASGDVLTSNGVGVAPTWAAPTSGGWTRITESTGTRTAANNEFILINNASCIVTLPAPTDNTTIALKAIVIPVDIQIKTSGAGVDIDGTDYSVIGLTLTTIYEQVSLISDGTDWFIY